MKQRPTPKRADTTTRPAPPPAPQGTLHLAASMTRTTLWATAFYITLYIALGAALGTIIGLWLTTT